MKDSFKKLRKNKYLLLVIVLLLFFFNSLIQIIPMVIFNIKKPTVAQQIYLNLFSSIIFLFILLLIYKDDLIKDFKKFKRDFSKIFNDAFQIWVLGLILMAFFNFLINNFTPNTVANNEQSLRNMIHINPILMLINTTFIAPITEELVFRKTFRDAFKNDKAFVLISGLFFGALHVVFSIGSAWDLLYLLPYCSLGIAFSYIYVKTKNVWGSISIHMMHNFIITLLNIFLIGALIW